MTERPRAQAAPPAEPERGIINAWDVAKAARALGYRGPTVWVVAERGQAFGWGNRSGWSAYEHQAATWIDVQAAFPRVETWVTPTGSHLSGSVWMSATVLEHKAALRMDRTGKPVKWAEGVPCEKITHPDPWHSVTCGKPAVEVMATGRWNNSGSEQTAVCGTHRAAAKRVQANDAQRRVESEQRADYHRRRREERDASADWAARLAEEYGVKAEASTSDNGLRVETQPEHLYALLSTAAGLLRDVGVEWTEVQAEVAG